MNKKNVTKVITGMIATGVLTVSGIAANAGPLDFLYVGDYYTGNLLKYNTSGTPVGGQPFISNPSPGTNNGIKEGVHGTGNTIITVTGTTISRYTLSGSYINNVATGFSGIGNMALTSDAKYVYVPDESTSTLYKVDVATGAKVAQVTLSGVHDVVISGNYIYATGYTQNTGVVRYDLNLGNKTQVVAAGANGLTRPSGISVDPTDGSLWVMQNSSYASITHGSGDAQPTTGGVWHYKLNGGTWTFDKKNTSSLLQFAFGTDFGPDGKLYIATLGDFHVRNTGQQGSNPDYHNGVYTYDPTTNGIAAFLTTGAFDTATGDDAPGLGGLTGPKYIKWGGNFVTANDPGYVPEPSTLATGAMGVLMLGAILFRAKRRVKA